VVKIWYGVTCNNVYGPFFFAEETVHWGPYLDMLQHFLMPQLEQENVNIVVFQEDGAAPLWFIEVFDFLNIMLRCGCIGPIALPPNSPALVLPNFLCRS
jgi:hypothetical protein